MSIVKLDDGRFKVDVRPFGRSGKRFVRVFDLRRDAREYETTLLLRAKASPLDQNLDERRVSDFVKLWFILHGSTLKDAKYRYSRSLAVADRLGDPLVTEFTSSHFSSYRIDRLKRVSISTVNHETRYLRAIFNELIRLGQYDGKNPLASIRTFKEKAAELTFLSETDIERLLTECDNSSNTHCGPVARLCLATGARWSEANNLRAEHLHINRVVYCDTKNGKDRTVPIKADFYDYLRSTSFPVDTGRLFDGCLGAFRKAVSRSQIKLPDGQSTHVLRHTFASYQVMNGCDIRTLQEVLGHSDLKVTMRYAHLSPSYLEAVVHKIPKFQY